MPLWTMQAAVRLPRRLTAGVGVACVLITLLIFGRLRSPVGRGCVPPARDSVLRFQREESGSGRVQFQIVHGQEAYWELPAAAQPVGVMLYAHGCFHGGGDLWVSQPVCPRCLGLPQEVMWRRALLARGLAVVSLSSQDRVGRGCWFEVKRDGAASFARVARSVLKRAGLKGLPIYATGVSGGGMLVLTLPRAMPELRGVCAQVRGVPPEVLALPGGRKYPPAVFLHMAVQDPQTAQEVHIDMRALRAAGTPTAEIQIPPRPLTVEFITARANGVVPVPMAAAIVAQLTQGGWLAPNGTFLRAPRPSTHKWAPLLQKVVGQLSLKLDKSEVGELLNAAYARHEMMHDHVDAITEWLQGGGEGGQAGLDALVKADAEVEARGAAAWARALRRAGCL